MRVTPYGTRGSIATPGLATARYGGNTACVRVDGDDGTVLILDAGTGIRQLGIELPASLRRIDILLTHLHMDHIQGLGFFGWLFRPGFEVHLWGPDSATLPLDRRLSRYLSPPLFPVVLRDVPCQLELHHVPATFEVGRLRVVAERVCHPGPTVGYRIEEGDAAIAYLPDHEPALGAESFPGDSRWTSGFDLAEGVDLLLHDAQYTGDEYPDHVGWGHSSLRDALAFARLANARHLVPFHHDPGRDDDALERAVDEAVRDFAPKFKVTPAAEGRSFDL